MAANAKRSTGTTSRKQISKNSPMKRLADLRQETKINTTTNIRAVNTVKKYAEVVKRGRTWLEEFLNEEEKAKGCCEDGKEDEDREEDNNDENVEIADNSKANPKMATDLRGCLDGKPNQNTPEAIALFMSWKCYNEGRKAATANQIHAAFKYHYTHLNGDKYRGAWRYNEALQEWVGNPCDSAQVGDLHEGCKRKDGEAERRHSTPASIIIMQRLYAFSISTCPDNYLVVDAQSLAFKTRHLRFRAYSSLGFTIWTSETSGLQAKHIDRNPLPRPGATPSDPPFIQVNLRDRKNWQKKQAKNETQLNGHRYNLYPQKIRAICAYTHVSVWMDFSEKHILRRKYEPEDYIFPNINANGITVQNQPVTPEAVQKMIDEFTSSAGVPGAFTTHCFRRGGAQYRFMFAPIGERWTLARIRWWGGWAPNEKCDTLIRYLLDELNTYEEDHSDALAPIDRRASESHAGEAAEMSPVSAAECRSLFQTQSLATDCQYRLTNIPPKFPHSSFLPIRNTQIPSSLIYSSASFVPVVGDHQTTYIQAASSSTTQSSFLPDLTHVPTIPNIRPGPDGWKQVVRDWDHADPSRNHHYALRNWKPEWAKEMKLASIYNKRKLIATEFIEEFERDEERFKLAYPSYKKGIEQLLHEIRKSRQDRGLIKQRRGKHLRNLD
ncbi:uncharacterized protein C8R40DRAFT_1273810 [Lentinula edodes]|uniref:uncharacterized protein n=1 Tax=Lentinula edodes TaxID=5353 RepID=UPI001E8DDB89|nr:uncharacterized protein C8R40DRAFT_1273810 [Lentinula edodes]KAH7871951.1 hypothetical protein C8R40DRAFT_1273810 [Lentinula edodes]